MARLASQYAAVLRSVVDSKRLNAVSAEAEALYFRLLCVCDGAGRYHGDPWDVGHKAMSGRMKRGATLDYVRDVLAELQRAGLIRRYEVDEETILEIADFWRPKGQRRVIKFPECPHVGDAPSPDGGQAVPRKGTPRPHSGRGEGDGDGDGERDGDRSLRSLVARERAGGERTNLSTLRDAFGSGIDPLEPVWIRAFEAWAEVDDDRGRTPAGRRTWLTRISRGLREGPDHLLRIEAYCASGQWKNLPTGPVDATGPEVSIGGFPIDKLRGLSFDIQNALVNESEAGRLSQAPVSSRAGEVDPDSTIGSSSIESPAEPLSGALLEEAQSVADELDELFGEGF